MANIKKHTEAVDET